MSVIDQDGLRAGIGIILINRNRRLLWARRAGRNAWQFPQGGLKENETPEQAMYRELYEEIGLRPRMVKVAGCTKQSLSYRLPKSMIRHERLPLCLGQKQKWFLLQFLGKDSDIHLDMLPIREFDEWRWVSYWYPLKKVIDFKKHVYRNALQEFVPLVFTKHI